MTAERVRPFLTRREQKSVLLRTYGTATVASTVSRSHDTHRISGDPQQLNCVFHSSLTFTGLDLPWFIWLVYQSDQYIASTVRSSYMSHFECMLERCDGHSVFSYDSNVCGMLVIVAACCVPFTAPPSMHGTCFMTANPPLTMRSILLVSSRSSAVFPDGFR